MLSHWTYIGLLLAIAAGLPSAPIVLTWILGPRRSNAAKNSTYECGIEPVGNAWVQFKAQYYVFALGFVVFDAETVFLFPFAAAFDRVDLWAVGEVIVFMIILAGGLVYAWRKGALEWA
jgi:NADH:ubiquinone oxidoreductase subunit 3 (subunit A)